MELELYKYMDYVEKKDYYFDKDEMNSIIEDASLGDSCTISYRYDIFLG